jgi:hypothetical protein
VTVDVIYGSVRRKGYSEVWKEVLREDSERPESLRIVDLWEVPCKISVVRSSSDPGGCR